MACCLPDAPGRCPGPAYCPIMQELEQDPREPAPGTIINLSYVEFDAGRVHYVEWTENSGAERFSGWDDGRDNTPIPEIVRKALVAAVTERV